MSRFKLPPLLDVEGPDYRQLQTSLMALAEPSEGVTDMGTTTATGGGDRHRHSYPADGEGGDIGTATTASGGLKGGGIGTGTQLWDVCFQVG